MQHLRRFDSSDDDEKDLKRRISGFETRITENEESIATLTDELAALKKGTRAAEPSQGSERCPQAACAAGEPFSVIFKFLPSIWSSL